MKSYLIPIVSLSAIGLAVAGPSVAAAQDCETVRPDDLRFVQHREGPVHDTGIDIEGPATVAFTDVATSDEYPDRASVDPQPDERIRFMIDDAVSTATADLADGVEEASEIGDVSSISVGEGVHRLFVVHAHGSPDSPDSVRLDSFCMTITRQATTTTTTTTVPDESTSTTIPTATVPVPEIEIPRFTG